MLSRRLAPLIAGARRACSGARQASALAPPTRPGRYRFTAIGTSPEGTRATGSRKVRAKKARRHKRR